MSRERRKRKQQHVLFRWLIFILGLLIMSFGIVLMIKANLGSAPWDVFHIGLKLNFGLTIGTWSIIVGIAVIGVTSILTRAWPKLGALVNMVLVGVFIDIFMFLLTWLEPTHVLLRLGLLIAGILINGYGIGLYIAPQCGAGPRDSLMLAVAERTKWKVQYVRSGMEVLVLLAGWLLGGPVFIGTVLFTFGIGTVVGYTLPQCQKTVDRWLSRLGAVSVPETQQKIDSQAVKL